MASQIERVRPGDVISSDLINRIIDKLAEIEGQVGNGGTNGGSQVITSFDPAGQQAAGQPLTIIGNFDFPQLSQNIVTIDELLLPSGSFLPGSDSTHITFKIPESFGGAAPRPVTIRVRRTSNEQEGQRPYTILPQVHSAVPDPILTPSAAANPNPSNFDTAGFGGLLQTGLRARIAGQHLAPTPIVTMRVQTGPGIFVNYPKPGQPALAIDTANSTDSLIVFTVPAITEISQSTNGPAIVDVTIPGAINMASINTTVRHM